MAHDAPNFPAYVSPGESLDTGFPETLTHNNVLVGHAAKSKSMRRHLGLMNFCPWEVLRSHENWAMMNLARG